MTPTYFFLDCEWADVLGAELVSLALVSEDGRRRFYAERDPLPVETTDFVRAVVYPLLQRGAFAMQDVTFTRNLRSFLSEIDMPIVVYDYQNDGALLRHALSGFDLPDDEAQRGGPIPKVGGILADRGGLLALLLEDWFSAHPTECVRRHHAAVDAEGLRQAWRVATGSDRPAWALPTLNRLSLLAGQSWPDQSD